MNHWTFLINALGTNHSEHFGTNGWIATLFHVMESKDSGTGWTGASRNHATEALLRLRGLLGESPTYREVEAFLYRETQKGPA